MKQEDKPMVAVVEMQERVLELIVTAMEAFDRLEAAAIPDDDDMHFAIPAEMWSIFLATKKHISNNFEAVSEEFGHQYEP